MSPQEQFAAAVTQGMAASPFASSAAEPVYYRVATSSTPLVGCLVRHWCDTAPLEETGIQPGHKIVVQIPKTIWGTKPNEVNDVITYQGRDYKFVPPSGTEPWAPCWVIRGMSPLT